MHSTHPYQLIETKLSTIRCICKLDSTMMIKQIVYFVLLIVIHNIRITISVKSEPNYYRYLQQFGYTPKVEGRLFSAHGGSPYSEGIKTLQRLYKLPVSHSIRIIDDIYHEYHV